VRCSMPRAVGWHLLTASERAQMDRQQWQQHCGQLEAEGTAKAGEAAAQRAAAEQQLEELKVRPCLKPFATHAATGQLRLSPGCCQDGRHSCLLVVLAISDATCPENGTTPTSSA